MMINFLKESNLYVNLNKNISQGLPYEDVKIVRESEKVWERLLKKRIIGKGAKDELSKGLEHSGKSLFFPKLLWPLLFFFD